MQVLGYYEKEFKRLTPEQRTQLISCDYLLTVLAEAMVLSEPYVKSKISKEEQYDLEDKNNELDSKITRLKYDVVGGVGYVEKFSTEIKKAAIELFDFLKNQLRAPADLIEKAKNEAHRQNSTEVLPFEFEQE